MSKPNKHRRMLNRRNETREAMTKITASEDEQREPLKGFESHYEITRNGDVYSKRLKRFIKHKFMPYGDDYSTWIEFQLAGESHNIGVGKAVADTYFSESDRKNIIESIPEEIKTVDDMKKSGLPALHGKIFGVTSRATFYVLKEALLNGSRGNSGTEAKV